MSGFDATRKLREWPEARDIPVIGLSAAAMPRDRKRAEEAGLFRNLTKPVDIDLLVGVIEEVLASKDAPMTIRRKVGARGAQWLRRCGTYTGAIPWQRDLR